jgi:hypothetical protein
VTGTHTLEDRNQCGLTGPGDIVNANPLLGPLQDNGGTTSTLALGVGSPAINAGSNCLDAASMPLVRDQRGITRPQGPSCDLGAFEFRAPAFAGSPQISGTAGVGRQLTCNPPTVTSPDGAPTLTFQWLRDGTPIAGGTAQSYTVATGDAGHTLSCQVTATYAATAAQGSLQVTSAGTPVPPPSPPPAAITSSGPPSTTIVNGVVSVIAGERVSCPAGGAPCTVKITATARTKKKRKPVTIAKASFTIAAGATAAVKFKLTKAGARLLARLRTIKAKLTITVTHGADPPVSTTRTITLHSPKRHRR